MTQPLATCSITYLIMVLYGPDESISGKARRGRAVTSISMTAKTSVDGERFLQHRTQLFGCAIVRVIALPLSRLQRMDRVMKVIAPWRIQLVAALILP